jgi:hypothetical protein
MKKVPAPVLALVGSLDRQVAPDENLAALKTGLRNVTIVKFDGLNHLFQLEQKSARARSSPSCSRTDSCHDSGRLNRFRPSGRKEGSHNGHAQP